MFPIAKEPRQSNLLIGCVDFQGYVGYSPVLCFLVPSCMPIDAVRRLFTHLIWRSPDLKRSVAVDEVTQVKRIAPLP